jgi:type IV secretory pathway VirD2 relaxase
MKKRIVDLRGESAIPLLDIVSYGRRGPGHTSPLTQDEIAHVARTVRRVPEVMIKVSGGARSTRGVARHLDYIGREGEGTVETDDGVLHQEKGFERALLKDWDLDMDEHRRHTQRTVAGRRKAPKLVHNLVFSMPKGTPADKLNEAVRRFAMEKFALQHRYAMALHTDQGHPHVHVVVKAVGEQGERLHIRKATLRDWRRDFAQCLRDLGLEANATERAVRGQTRQSKSDGIYRAMQRGESTHMRQRAEGVARELARGRLAREAGADSLRATRRAVVEGWETIADNLDRAGRLDLANLARRFVERMPPPMTERQWIAERLCEHERHREGPTR